MIPGNFYPSYMQKAAFVIPMVVLGILLGFFAEVQGLYHPHVSNSIDKRDIFVLEMVFVISVLLNKKVLFPDLRRLPRYIIVPAGLWLISGFISALCAVNQELAILTYAEHIIVLLFSLTVFCFLSAYAEIEKYVPIIISLGIVFYAIFLRVSYFPDPYKLHLMFHASMIEEGFRHVRHFGYYLAILVVVSAGLVHSTAYDIRKGMFWLGFGALTLSWMMMVWIGGRGPFFALGLSFFVFVFIFRIREYKQLIGVLVVTLFIGGALSLFMPNGFGLEYLLSRWFSSFGFTKEELTAYSSNRLLIWEKCLPDIISNPFFGVGQNGFFVTCRLRGLLGISQPHGFHVQALLDWGVLGTLAFFGAIFGLMYKGYQQIKSNAQQEGRKQVHRIFAYWGVVMLLVFSTIDGIMFQRFSLMYFAFFMAVIQLGSNRLAIAESEYSRLPYALLMYVVVAIILYLSIIDYQIIPDYISI